MPRIAENLKDRRFGRLVVIRKGVTGAGRTAWKCRCDCGAIKNIMASSLRRGTQSCGCYQKQRMTEIKTKHGMHDHPLYSRWNMMLQRCTNPKNNAFHRYGGRGIKVCRAWHDFIRFHEWAASNGYSSELWLERKNNDGDYKPSNCRWATLSEQARNRRPIKLTLRQAAAIKRALDKLPRGGRTGAKKKLAQKYNVSPTTIANIAAGDTWKRLSHNGNFRAALNSLPDA